MEFLEEVKSERGFYCVFYELKTRGKIIFYEISYLKS